MFKTECILPGFGGALCRAFCVTQSLDMVEIFSFLPSFPAPMPGGGHPASFGQDTFKMTWSPWPMGNSHILGTCFHGYPLSPCLSPTRVGQRLTSHWTSPSKNSLPGFQLNPFMPWRWVSDRGLQTYFCLGSLQGQPASCSEMSGVWTSCFTLGFSWSQDPKHPILTSFYIQKAGPELPFSDGGCYFVFRCGRLTALMDPISVLSVSTLYPVTL